MNPELFINAYRFALRKLTTSDPKEIFCEGEIPPANQYYLEPTLQMALVLLYRVGIPYVNIADLEGGDFFFIFQSFGLIGPDNLNDSAAPSAWLTSESEFQKLSPVERVTSDHIQALKHFEPIIKLFGLMGYNISAGTITKKTASDWDILDVHIVKLIMDWHQNHDSNHSDANVNRMLGALTDEKHTSLRAILTSTRFPSIRSWLEHRNLGKKTVAVLEDLLKSFDLYIGMTIPDKA